MTSQSQETQLAVIQNDISYIRQEMQALNSNVSTGYVPMPQFNALKDRVDLIQRAIFFLIGILVVAVLGAVFRLVFR